MATHQHLFQKYLMSMRWLIFSQYVLMDQREDFAAVANLDFGDRWAPSALNATFKVGKNPGLCTLPGYFVMYADTFCFLS
jgi:hypothetical protein